MNHVNIEIKARVKDPSGTRDYLLSHGAEFRGLDLQTDTYFNVQKGRLKLREGNIENNLIYYERADKAGLKHSDFTLLGCTDPGTMKKMLTAALGILAIVQKKREIYYIGNVKFHIDELSGLGTFIEIEAGNLSRDLPVEELREQCAFYMKEFGIGESDLVEGSYSDLVMELNGSPPLRFSSPGSLPGL
jgi:predicted adenylyl cyclase CyaB